MIADAQLPVIFLGLMAFAMLAYVLLDGYDLGVGILLGGRPEAERDRMIAAIGPFWDANETWLVLGVGLLLVAFPRAHGVILGELYVPVVLMLLGLVLRGAAFDFRVKGAARHKARWDRAFQAGSLLAALAQGYMLGLFVVGFVRNPATIAFALGIGLALAAGYVLLGAGWLVLKTEGELQRLAARRGRRALWATVLGIGAVSIVTPWMSETVAARWFRLPELLLLAPVPLATLALAFVADRLLRAAPLPGDRFAWAPFACGAGLFTLAFFGLAYSLYPYLVIDRLTIWDAASAPASLRLILIGALFTLPAIVAYSAFAYRVFRGKATALHYG